ncbi:Protein of uncharacterised function (DUF2635) [Canicola haemoglobinophilus]|uniref:Protein of uncharacterized function (DUF2635) n=2 Tax=Canicola haemoglobinophilus TaxID=733 RepID=A0AB38HCI1_9PAST|nr:Protein of uncharacterised function (DUF2635) [Canicola haemoglobinophilus]STO69069.1 Protein of uncharacterised function (DUF2635) [Canicola haemoglobinophilus]
MFKLKPKKGLVIRDPETFEPLAETGEEKPRTSYWLNHLKNGDVEIVEPKSRKGEK